MFFISIFNVITYGFYTYSFRLPLDKSIAQNYELFYRLCDMTSLFSKIVTLMGDKEAETTIQTAAPYGIIFLRNSGAAVGNGGNHPIRTPDTYRYPHTKREVSLFV